MLWGPGLVKVGFLPRTRFRPTHLRGHGERVGGGAAARCDRLRELRVEWEKAPLALHHRRVCSQPLFRLMVLGTWFADDSSLEGDGFELPVPRLRNWRNSRRAGTFQLHGRRLVRAAIRPQSPAYLY